MKFRAKQQSDATPNLTPLIDVVFLLLIFFMVTTSFSQDKDISITLPESHQQDLLQPNNLLSVTIDHDGRYFIKGKQLADGKQLRHVLSQFSQGKALPPLRAVADAKTPHQAVVTVMDIAGQLGFAAVQIATSNLPAVPSQKRPGTASQF